MQISKTYLATEHQEDGSKNSFARMPSYTINGKLKIVKRFCYSVHLD